MRYGLKLPFLTVCFLTFLKFNALAQCDQSALVTAAQDYEAGLFSEAKQPIIRCFMNEKFSDLKLTNDAYRMLSLISLKANFTKKI